MPDSKMMEEYVNRVLKHLGDEGLSKVEEVLGAKLKETQDRASDLRAGIERMQETLKQAQERLKGLSMEYTETMSKAAGITESLIALKFGDQIKKEEKAREEKAAKGNGSKDLSAPTKKKKTKRDRPTRQASA